MTHTDTPAARFRALHTRPRRPLLLANVWDAASARLVEASGVAAIATTSAGVAWAHGRSDGNSLLRDEAVAAVARVVAAVSLPVTADIEGGYARDAAGVERTVASVIEAGAVGINLEDRGLRVDEMLSRIRAARQAADRAGVPIFINARTDVYLEGLLAEEQRLVESVERANRYLAAGADGAFIPGTADVETISALVDRIDGPVNVMAGPGAPTVDELAQRGVARISLGSAVAQSAYARVRGVAKEFVSTGTYTALADGIEYSELNALSA